MERDHDQRRIKDLAYTDELTGLSNRTHFYIIIDKLMKRSARNNRQMSVLYIDLDHFKNVNDSLGHDAGDILLKEVAQRLKKACRENDYIARLSGDEFCIVMEDVREDYNAVHVAQRCLELVSKPLELLGRNFIPACSIGIAHYPDDGDSLQVLLKAADTALYAAKDAGKNRYAFYNEELTLKAEYRFELERSLREAIENQRLSLVYQPKIDEESGKIIGVEALSRWYHPQLGEISPVDFIRIAEQIGMIKPLTEWVLKTACNQVKQWKKLDCKPVRMVVNISPSHFLDSDLVPLIERVLIDTDMEPEELELDVTEGVVQTDNNNLAVFDRLKRLGVLLAIDDFGIGYSSFASLKHLHVDSLKVDKYFINDMIFDDKAQILVRSMIEMGHKLGYQITAEGVEKYEQFHLLKELGCNSAQGYLFSKPVSADKIPILLDRCLINAE
jgi:diguanylate cyclase (GGDEF)-like protein